MKKFIIFIIIFLFFMVISGYTVAFTDTGNNIIKPYAKEMIKQKSGFDVEFNKFKIRPTNIDIEAVINTEIPIKINGMLSIFSKNLNLNYDIEILNLNSIGINLKEKMAFAGLIKGTFNDFKATGAGILLGSNVNFDTRIKDFSLLALDLDAKNIELDKILALINKPIYAKGKITATAKIAPQNNIANGVASIELTNITTNNELIAKDFNIKMPENFTANGKITADIKDNIITAKSALITPFATLGSQKSIYEISSQTLSSDIKVIVDDLTKIEPLISQKLKGSLKADSNIIITKNKIKNFDTVIYWLGGEIKAVLDGEKIVANINSIKLDEILKTLNQPILANGLINGDVRLDSLDFYKLNGVAKIKLENGIINHIQAKQIINKDVPSGLKFSSIADVRLEDSVANFTTIANLINKENKKIISVDELIGSFDVNQNILKSNFKINIDDLKSLSFLTGQKFNANLNVTGDLLKTQKDLVVNAASKLFGGNMITNIINNNLDINLNSFTVKDLTDFFALEHFYDGVGDIKANYNLSSQNGKFDAIVSQGQLVPTQLTQTIANLTGKDITTEIYKNTKIVGTINQNLINFDANMSANRSNISIKNGKFDITTKLINIPLKANYEKTDIELSITGTSSEPKYSLSSEYLKNKAAKEIDKILDKKLGGNNESKKEIIKGLLKNLF